MFGLIVVGWDGVGIVCCLVDGDGVVVLLVVCGVDVEVVGCEVDVVDVFGECVGEIDLVVVVGFVVVVFFLCVVEVGFDDG